jgi:hypothetical protein
MTGRRPPRLARWLIERLAGRYQRESFIGDLAEEYAHGRSRVWYWKQVVSVVLCAGARVWQAALETLSLHAPGSLVPRSLTSLLRRMTRRLVSILLLTALGVGTLTWAAATHVPACPAHTQACQKAR